MPFALWTRQAVQQLIKREYAIAMPIRTVGEYLKRWGFIAQRPVKRAYEQNPKGVAGLTKTVGNCNNDPLLILFTEGKGLQDQ